MPNWSQFIESPGGGSAAPTPANDNPWSKFIEGQPDPNAEAEKEIADRESVLADPLPEETKAAIRQRHLKPPTPVPAPSPEIPAPPPTAGDVAKGYLSAIPSVLTHAATATGRGLVGLGQAAYLLPSGRPEDQIGAKPGDVSALGEINAAAKEANARADTGTAAAPGATTVAGFAGNMVPWFINPALGAGSMAGESYLDQIEHHPDSPGKARVAGAIMGLAGFAMGGAGKIGGAALAPLERGLSKLAMPTIGKVASVAGEGYSMGVPLAMGSSVSESLWDTDAGQRALEEGLTSPTMALVVLFLTRHHFSAHRLIGQFAYGLIFGGIIGTYSSDFIAAPLVFWWNERKKGEVFQELGRRKNAVVEEAETEVAAEEGVVALSPARARGGRR